MTRAPARWSSGAVRSSFFAVGALAALDLLSLWSVAASDTVASWGPAAVLAGGGCAAAGALGLREGVRARSSWLLVLAGGSLLAAPLLSELVSPRLGEVAASGGAATLPCALLGIVPVPRAARTQRALLLLVALSGAAAVGAVAAGAVTAAAAPLLVGSLALLAAGWVQFEATRAAERRQVLWLVLGVCGVASVIALFMFAVGTSPVDPAVVSFVAALLCLPVPLTAGVALLCPDRWDVRSVISRAVLTAVMLLLSVSVFGLSLAVLRATLGRQPTAGVLGVVAAVIAALHHPTLVQARRTIDELLFGGRVELIPTLTRLGDQLSASTAPAEWLESLRSALAVPGLVLQDGTAVLATAGTVGPEVTAVPLRVGETTAGELLVGLPRDQLRLPAATQAVLQLVATPLAQALQAARLSEQLQRSRGEVVGVLEEERRRMRRDLHDGLGPTLTGVAYTADAAANLVLSSPTDAAALLHDLRADVAEAIAEIRRIVYGLRPRALDELGLVAAVRQQTDRLLARDGRPFTVDVSAPALPQLPAAVEVVAYRVAVEAVTNVARHAAVDRADVRFALDGPAVLEVVVTDSGVSSAPWSEGVGIASMRERVEQIGGSLAVGSVAGGVVRARLPIHQGGPPRPPGDVPGD